VTGVGQLFAYDEVRDGDRQRRPAYAKLAQRLGWDPVVPPPAVRERFRGQPLGDDHSILPVPLALTDADYRAVRDGVAQRARVLQMFYVDAFLGDQRFLRSGTSLTSELLSEMLSVIGTSVDYFRAWWSGHDRAEVRFVYGPDLVRDAAGRWVVLEDNVGCVGGCADTHFVAHAYREAIGRLEARPCPDMSRAVRRWLETLGLAPDDSGVVALVSDGDTLDEYLPARFEEDERRAQLMHEMGVDVVDDQGFERVCRRAEIRPDRLKAVVNIGVSSGPTWPLLRDVAFGQRHVAILNAPGTIVLGHKGLLPFIDEMIRFYTHEDPILVSPPTLLLQDGVLPGDLDSWVVKTATGCRGDGVFILRWQKPDQLNAVQQMIRKSWPMNAAVAQHYVEPSRIYVDDDAPIAYRVEVRAIAYVLDWQQVHVSEQSVAKLVRDEVPGHLNDVFRAASYAPVVRDTEIVEG